MLRVHFLDTNALQFSDSQRTVIRQVAEEADALVRQSLPLAEQLHLLVEGSPDVLPTGDNAHTIAPHLIRWLADPARDITAVARDHLAQAFAHEAFHAARFRRLAEEAGSHSWTQIAIGEGLATAFARDAAGANEPWAVYDPAVISSWAAELLAQPGTPADMTNWKFQHQDGRQWIAYRVGTWIVDSLREETGQSPADLVWTRASEIAGMVPAVLDLVRDNPPDS
jgi:hypothetical protein